MLADLNQGMGHQVAPGHALWSNPMGGKSVVYVYYTDSVRRFFLTGMFHRPLQAEEHHLRLDCYRAVNASDSLQRSVCDSCEGIRTLAICMVLAKILPRALVLPLTTPAVSWRQIVVLAVQF